MISLDDFMTYVDWALDGMVEIVEELGDDLANRSLDLPGANSPFVILTHCLGVMAYWGGEVAAGRSVERDRPAEFRASGHVADLVARVRASRDRLVEDLADLDLSAPPRGRVGDNWAGEPMARTSGGALVHIYEELAQHRGQMEVTRDVLRAPWVQLAAPA